MANKPPIDPFLVYKESMKMAGKGHSKVGGNWQDKIHELEFAETEKNTLKTLASADKRDTIGQLVDLIVDNNSLKVKSAEYFDSYTVSYTLDRSHPKYPGHTFWFWHNDIAQGIAVMAAFVETMLQDHLESGLPGPKRGQW